MNTPWALRVEHFAGAVLGLGDTRPRLSWRLPDGAAAQQAYEIELDGRPSGAVPSRNHVLVSWPGAPLGSRQRVVWRVRVRTDVGQSPWSPTAWLETGLLQPEDWVARWIEPAHELASSVPILRRDFELDAPVTAGRLYATAHGIYECFLNGRRVGDLELTPGFTSYSQRLQVQAYDVSDLLVQGRNRWEVVLTDGWYRGRTGGRQRRAGYGTTLGFLGQLEAGGTVVATGPGWECAGGPLVAADLMAGQIEDHRHGPTDRWPALLPGWELGPLAWSPAPPVRRVQELRPVSVGRIKEGRQVVDLGQNINGWLRLCDLGVAGSRLTILHGEALDRSGDVTQDNLMMTETHDVAEGPFQVDQVVSTGRAGEVFEPRHTTHGFRYARIEGHPGRLTPDDVAGIVVHTDLRRTGWFRCSDTSLNRFHDAAEWSFRDNACDIPTDCPQRERSGWTGDWQLFVPTAAFLYDVAGFSLKWLRDVAADQLPDGAVTNFAPDPMRRQVASEGEVWPMLQGSSGWGDAIVIVPWELWRAYGDVDVLAELWPSMVRWLEFAAAAARTRRHPSREAERPRPLPHEEFLWDGGFHWGEWHEPGVTDLVTSLSADQGSVGTAYLHRSSSLAARIGALLGHAEQAERFAQLAADAGRAWRTEYIGDDGRLSPDTQANHVRALAFGLVPPEWRAAAAERLVQLVAAAGGHLGTGFLATPFLLPVLAETGHLDVAYELLAQRTPPSWLTMVDRGATTVWESWEGVGADGVAHDSLNHYSKGAVVSFLHRHVAGIQMVDGEPGYRRFRVAPDPGGGLTWAQAIHDSPYGRIESSWRRDRDLFELTVTVPAGTEAQVVLPGGRTERQGPGTRVHAVALDPPP